MNFELGKKERTLTQTEKQQQQQYIIFIIILIITLCKLNISQNTDIIFIIFCAIYTSFFKKNGVEHVPKKGLLYLNMLVKNLLLEQITFDFLFIFFFQFPDFDQMLHMIVVIMLNFNSTHQIINNQIKK
eukprot:TRINITY_DN16316_c0_g1_i1.p2 TRINITY_DN16316_c0_g1~~TRINITY_DN16316_c0_g1_i1.p2  ORF type:complete len:129 (+),score=6.99 TRINITY_DN16316_c0_g1_i1:211-597(+)